MTVLLASSGVRTVGVGWAISRATTICHHTPIIAARTSGSTATKGIDEYAQRLCAEMWRLSVADRNWRSGGSTRGASQRRLV